MLLPVLFVCAAKANSFAFDRVHGPNASKRWSEIEARWNRSKRVEFAARYGFAMAEEVLKDVNINSNLQTSAMVGVWRWGLVTVVLLGYPTVIISV